jgi:hypothetical protein
MHIVQKVKMKGRIRFRKINHPDSYGLLLWWSINAAQKLEEYMLHGCTTILTISQFPIHPTILHPAILLAAILLTRSLIR